MTHKKTKHLIFDNLDKINGEQLSKFFHWPIQKKIVYASMTQEFNLTSATVYTTLKNLNVQNNHRTFTSKITINLFYMKFNKTNEVQNQRTQQHKKYCLITTSVKVNFKQQTMSSVPENDNSIAN